jgi:hypothetical protein
MHEEITIRISRSAVEKNLIGSVQQKAVDERIERRTIATTKGHAVVMHCTEH